MCSFPSPMRMFTRIEPVGNMEFRTFGVAVFRAEFRVQVIEQQSERFEVFALVIVVDSLLIGLRIDFALRGVQYRSDE